MLVCMMTDNPQKQMPAAEQAAGSLADMVAEPEAISLRQSLPITTIAKIAILTGVLVAMNYRQFPTLVRGWLDDPNWSHGFIIPLFSLYLLYARRAELFVARRRSSPWGLAAIVAAGVGQVLSYWIRNPWSSQVTMVLLALGLVLYLGGWQVLRLTWLPILFLVFAMPIPGIYYGRIALPLQNLAAKFSANIIQLFGVTIEVAASKLTLRSASGQWYPLAVEEACSGVRLLMAFLALSVAMAYLAERPIWQRVIVVVMGVPVAIACNVIRVTITCSMYYLDLPELGQDFMHEFTGMLMLVPAFLMLWMVGWILSSLYIEVDDEDSPEADAPAEGSST